MSHESSACSLNTSNQNESKGISHSPVCNITVNLNGSDENIINSDNILNKSPIMNNSRDEWQSKLYKKGIFKIYLLLKLQKYTYDTMF